MENVILTVHLILALLLIGVVLLQRSEGGGLDMGSGGGGLMTGRQAANALSKATWALAILFLVTSTALTLMAAKKASVGSIIDQLGLSSSREEAPADIPALPDYVPPPGSPVIPGAPITPPAAETPAEAPAEEAPAPDDMPITPPAASESAAEPAPENEAADGTADEAADEAADADTPTPSGN